MEIPKKNLLIIGSSQGGYGGIEAFMIAVAEAASEWPEFETRLCFKMVKGYTVREELLLNAQRTGAKVVVTSRSSWKLLKMIAWADILHIQNTPPDIIFPAYLARKRIFLTIHNWRKRIDNLHYYLWGIAAKLADKRWYNSNFVWNTWEPGKKFANSSCVPTICKLPNSWCEPEQRKGFLFIGRWIENKGIEELIAAYAKCHLNDSTWPLTIVGDGPLRPNILEMLQKLNLHSVQLPGFVDDKHKAQLLASAKWLLAPANTKEDLGLTPIEARSVGVPAIVTNDGGLPESGGESALIAEAGSASDLARCMMAAANMCTDEYKNRSVMAKRSLKHYLKPMSFYRKSFLG